MWRGLVNWHREWEDELLGVLDEPARAAMAQSGYRRRMAYHITRLSPIERRQLREFSLAYRGRHGYWLLARLFLAFTLAGVLWHLLAPGTGWMSRIVIANMLGAAFLISIFTSWFNYRQLVDNRWKLMRRVFTSGIGATLLVVVTKVWFMDAPLDKALEELPRFLGWVLGAGLLMLLSQLAVGVLRYRQYEMLTEQLQRDAERERLARELAESQLRMLRAQIEPHFLFNTLGAVQQLARHGAPRAAELTADLIAFLRASMGDMRSDQVSLATEFGLVDAYLKVMRTRLGERLRFSLALPRALEQVRVPSMLLLTLAENAIKHGIEPALRGGEITVSAERLAAGGPLRLRVRDSGVGMSAVPGAGTGLDNLRHRLRLAYGEGAALALTDADPGLVAEITIPHPGEASA